MTTMTRKTNRRAIRLHNGNDLGRPIKIHICKDGTFSIRKPGEPIFNGVAIAVFSTRTVKEAEELEIVSCFLCHAKRPEFPKGWMKVNYIQQKSVAAGRACVLEIEDLDIIADTLRANYQRILERSARG
jgi:hypothetical protein